MCRIAEGEMERWMRVGVEKIENDMGRREVYGHMEMARRRKNGR